MPAAGSIIRMRVNAAAEKHLRAGHPWLYAESIRRQSGEGQAGDRAVLYDEGNRFFAIGLFDPHSPIRVRVLHVGQPVELTPDWWRGRLEEALARRKGLMDEQTTGCRLIHGENDGWPALVLDRYDQTLVLKLYSAIWLPRLSEVTEWITGRLAPARLVLRLSRNLQAAARQTWNRGDGDVLVGPPVTGPVLFRETGLIFEADVERGQKTGFFLDQRENRRRVEQLAAGRTTLNAFSFNGGFSLYAARGGAVSVTDLDISAHALAGAERNLRRNREAGVGMDCRHECVQADAFKWLDETPRPDFDLIILDPPSLAKRATEKEGALRAYTWLARQARRRLRPGGILVAASCSAHVPAEEFFAVIQDAVRDGQAGRMEVMGTTGHPADHPALFREAEYLKCVYMRRANRR